MDDDRCPVSFGRSLLGGGLESFGQGTGRVAALLLLRVEHDRDEDGELRILGERITELPEGFEAHKRVAAILKSRKDMVAGTVPLDWGMGHTTRCVPPPSGCRSPRLQP